MDQILIQPTHPKATGSDTNGWACPHITPDEASLVEITLCPDCYELMHCGEDPVMVDSAGRVRVRWATAEEFGAIH